MPPDSSILTINGGSSTIKFGGSGAAAAEPRGVLSGSVGGIGMPGTVLAVKEPGPPEQQSINAGNHEEAAGQLIDWLRGRIGDEIAGVGHRVVHGGVHLLQHPVITDELLAALKREHPLDPAHLP